MADEVRGKQIINLSDITRDSVRSLGKELSGVNSDGNKKLILDHVFSFVGLSGGVGTSTIIANVASELTKMGRSVIIIDLNIMYPIQHSFFKLKQELETKDLCSFLGGEATLGECIKYPAGRDLGILIANNRGIVEHIDADSKDGSNALTECLERLSSLFDFVLIDCSNRLENELINTALYKSDRIMAILDENLEGLSNYNRLCSAMGACGIDYMRVKTILNKRTSIQYNRSILKDFNIDLIQVLPFELGIIESGLKGEIYCRKGASTSKTASAFVQGIKNIARSMERLSGSTADDEKEEANK